ncbi:MAG: HNH endonuclease [Planctomycetota bacterium]|jgi:5-methylcytosine-specific restriction endonuclease McrA
MAITTDKRSIRAERDPVADGRISGTQAALRDLQFSLARDFARVDACAHFIYEGCASVVEYGMKRGYSALETRFFVDLGHALAASPDLEERIRAGRIAIEAASTIGRIYRVPSLLRPGDDWLAYAQNDSIRSLRRRIRARLEEARQEKSGVVEVSVFVTARTKDEFERARVVASRKARQTLTDGQAFARVVTHYLDTFDPLRRKPRQVRSRPTSGASRGRYVPAGVRRTVRQRAGDRCEVAGCENTIHLQFAHRVPHAEGGERDADNLFLLCTTHHTLYDAGRLDPRDCLRPRTAPVNGRGHTGDANGASGPRERPSGPVGRSGTDPPVGVREVDLTWNGISVCERTRSSGR